MASAPHALHADGDGARRLNLADQIHSADVDAEFEGGRRNEHANLAVLQAMLGVETQFAGEAAVMAGDVFLAQSFAEGEGQPFGHFARLTKTRVERCSRVSSVRRL